MANMKTYEIQYILLKDGVPVRRRVMFLGKTTKAKADNKYEDERTAAGFGGKSGKRDNV